MFNPLYVKKPSFKVYFGLSLYLPETFGHSPIYSCEAYLFDKIPFKRSRQAERVYFVKHFLILFWAAKKNEEKSNNMIINYSLYFLMFKG